MESILAKVMADTLYPWVPVPEFSNIASGAQVLVGKADFGENAW